MRAAVIWMVLSAACSSSQAFRRPLSAEQVAAVGEAVEATPVTVRADGEPLQMVLDEAHLTDGAIRGESADGSRYVVPLDAVRSVSSRSRTHGMLDGMGLGALAGLAVGIPTAAVLVSNCSGDSCGLSWIAVPEAVIAGVLIGAITGAIIGHEHMLEIQ